MKRWEYITVGLGSVAALITIYTASKKELANAPTNTAPELSTAPTSDAVQLAQARQTAAALQTPQPIGTGNVTLPDGSSIPAYNGTAQAVAPPQTYTPPSDSVAASPNGGSSFAPASGCGGCGNKCGGSVTTSASLDVAGQYNNMFSVPGTNGNMPNFEELLSSILEA
jgi:hypothetical protein